MQALKEIYQDYCKKCCEGSMASSDHFEEIPCKILMLCFDKDCKEFRSDHLLFFASWSQAKGSYHDI